MIDQKELKGLLVVEKMTAVEVYAPGKLESILKTIEKAALSIVPDMSTKKGRDEIRSLAADVAKSKKHLDTLGLSLTEQARKTVKEVNADRKVVTSRLDELKKKVRRPLTDYEQAEKDAAAALISRVMEIAACGRCRDENGELLLASVLSEKLLEVKGILIDESFGEKANEAAIEKDLAITNLEKNIIRATKEEAETVELDRLRVEAEARSKQDYEDAMKKEAAAKADQEKQALIDKAKEDIARADQKRQANTVHRATVNNDILDVLISLGASEELGKDIIKAMVAGKVPHTAINY